MEENHKYKEIISLVLIVFCTLVIQIADHQINDWQNKKIISQGNIIYQFTQVMENSAQYNDYKLYKHLFIIEEALNISPELTYNLNNSLIEDYPNGTMKLFNKYEIGEIDAITLIKEMRDVSYRLYEILYIDLKKQVNKTNSLFINEPRWCGIKWSFIKHLFFIFQAFLIVLLLFIILNADQIKGKNKNKPWFKKAIEKEKIVKIRERVEEHLKRYCNILVLLLLGANGFLVKKNFITIATGIILLSVTLVFWAFIEIFISEYHKYTQELIRKRYK